MSRPFLAFVLVALAVPAVAQDLGEAARKEAERRGKSEEPAARTHVITGRQPRPVPAPPSPAAARPASPAAPEPATDLNETRKARGAELKVLLQSAETALRAAEAALRQAQARLDAANHTAYQTGFDGRVSARAAVEAAEHSVQSARAARDEVEDTARRERIPPGYLR